VTKTKPWQELRRDVGYVTRIFTVHKVHSRSPLDGREHPFEVIETPDWVNVIALAPDGQVLLVRQWRHGRRAISLEVPGGMVDPGETPLAAAKRELEEETGYRAGSWEQIGVVEPNPAIQTNLTFTFLAKGAEPTGKIDPDEDEQIEVLKRPLKDIPDLLAEGAIQHSLVVAAFAHLAVKGGIDLGARSNR